MRPLSSKHFLIVLLALSMATSCKKEDFPEANAGPVANEDPVANEGDYGNIAYFAKASGAGVKRIGTQSKDSTTSVAVEWSAASVYVEKIAFVGARDNLLDTTIFVGKNIDIFSAEALAGIIQLPTGSYKDVKVKLFALKSEKSEMAFNFTGSFINTKGGRDSVKVGSSYPFEASLDVTDITVNPSDEYNVTFTFNLDKVLAGISTELLQTARYYPGPDNSKLYTIWKGGSGDEPFYDQVIENWQTVASVEVSKK